MVAVVPSRMARQAASPTQVVLSVSSRTCCRRPRGAEGLSDVVEADERVGGPGVIGQSDHGSLVLRNEGVQYGSAEGAHGVHDAAITGERTFPAFGDIDLGQNLESVRRRAVHCADFLVRADISLEV